MPLVDVNALDPIGVELKGIDVAAVTDGEVEGLAHALARHGVVVLRDQHVDDAQFLAFLRRFGRPVFTKGETPVDGFPDLNVVSNVGRTTPPRSVFHVDTSYVAHPPAYTALRAVTVPEHGGQTVFTNQYRACETLPMTARQRLRGRTIRHVATELRRAGEKELSAHHPVFRRHPLSGRTSLYISTPQRCLSISGMGADESADWIAYLHNHSISEDNQLHHAWQPGDVVMWDNGVVLHKADHSGVVGDRVMHRGMVDGYAAGVG